MDLDFFIKHTKLNFEAPACIFHLLFTDAQDVRRWAIRRAFQKTVSFHKPLFTDDTFLKLYIRLSADSNMAALQIKVNSL